MRKMFGLVLLSLFVANSVGAREEDTCQDNCDRGTRACHKWCAYMNNWEYKGCMESCQKDTDACNSKCQ